MQIQIDDEITEKRPLLNPSAPTREQLEFLLQTVVALIERHRRDAIRVLSDKFAAARDKKTREKIATSFLKYWRTEPLVIQTMRFCMVMTSRGSTRGRDDLCLCHDDCGIDPDDPSQPRKDICLDRRLEQCQRGHVTSCSSKAFVRHEKRKNGSLRKVYQESGGPIACLYVNGMHMASWVMMKTDKFNINILADEAEDLADTLEFRLTGTWRFHDEDGDRRVQMGLDREVPPTEM